MAGNLIIRKCEIQDESAFVRLNLEFMKESLIEDPFWTSVELPTQKEMQSIFREALRMHEYITIFVAEVDGEVVGFANTWIVYSIWAGGMMMTIDDLFIAASHRGSGNGQKMMAHLVNFAEQNNYKRIQLHSGINNKRAHSLYGKMGFIEEETMFFMKTL